MQLLDSLFLVIIVFFSAIIHEVMHGVAANSLGDPTARYAGRLTLNPLKHIDPFGSIILPAFLIYSHSPIFFAWAKPVPYNPYNLKPGRWSEAIVAGAGPASNLVIALLSGFLIRLHVVSLEVSSLLFMVVVINIMLCVFNLLPVPPLDGSKVLGALLPRRFSLSYASARQQLEGNPFLGMIIVLFIIYVFGSAYSNLIYTLAQGIAGQ